LEEAKCSAFKTEGENSGKLLFSCHGYGDISEDHLPQRAVQLKEWKCLPDGIYMEIGHLVVGFISTMLTEK